MNRAVLFLVFAANIEMFAQVGYPGGGYPPGGYPPGGGYPGSGPRIPMPWPRKGKHGGTDSKQAETLTRVSGKLNKIDDKLIVVDAPDSRVVQFQREAKTKFYKDTNEIAASQFKPGDEVSVEAAEDKDGNFHARTVRLEKGAAASTPTPENGNKSPDADVKPTLTTDAPPPAPDPGDPGPPVLKRGAPPRRETPDIDDDTVATAAPAAAAPAAAARPQAPAAEAENRDPVIEKARVAAEAFSERLPNYVCKEFMARFMSNSRPVDWKALDVVSTEVLYEGGKETYRNIELNGKPVHKPIEEMGGSWSTGEFGSILRDLFSRSAAAEFSFRRDSTIGGTETKMYDFTVEQPHSHWHVQVPSQSINPAFKGSVWIDPKSGRVLRIEMQARALPGEFPLDTVESAVDYANVRIGEGEFLLPVHAENLSCERGSSDCSRNAIDFRNYHKYNAESSITFASGEK